MAALTNIALLALLGTAAHQDDQMLAILAEINPVGGTKVDAQFEHAGKPTPLTFDILPRESLVTAVATLTAACGFNRSNQTL